MSRAFSNIKRTLLAAAVVVAGVISLLTMGCATEQPWWKATPARRAQADGAIVTLQVHVVDETGAPVEDASVGVGFWAPQGWGAENDKGETDETGYVELEARCRTDGTLEAKKEGYYPSRLHVDYTATDDESIEETLFSRRWKEPQPVQVTLKRGRNPAPMIAYQLFDAIVPVRDKLIGFDLWEGDWVGPYGTGKCEDVKIRLNTEERQYGKKIKRETTAITFFFPKQGDGICICEAFPTSALRSAYTVDQSLHFHQTLTLKVPAFPNEVLPSSQYLTFRVRSEVTDDGTILNAHYGKMYPIIDARGSELTIGAIYLNPRTNDMNLEFDPKRNLAPDETLEQHRRRRVYLP